MYAKDTLNRYLSKREIVGDVIEKMLMSLEEDGFIKIEEDENALKRNS